MKITVSNKYDKRINSPTVLEEKSSTKSDGKTLARVKKDNVVDMLSSNQPEKTREAKQKQEVEKTVFYQLDDTSKSEILLDELEKYEIGAVGGRGISVYSSEEEVGLKLGELKLKGETFVKFAKASHSVNKAMMNVIDNFIKTTAESLKQYKEQLKREMLEPHKLPAYKREAVFAVVDKIVEEYEATGGMIISLKKGSAFAQNQFEYKVSNQEIQDEQFGVAYWKNFNQDKREKHDKLGDYNKQKSGFEELAESWNQFAVKITDDSSVIINLKKENKKLYV